MMNKSLTEKEFVESYDSRYKSGYMESWPKAKKNRVRRYIQSLGLPMQGRVLDFGCGKGDFTRVIKEALPLWDVYGSDISKVGLEMASLGNHNCTFLTIDEIREKGLTFDLLFSNHVIEHVLELPPVFDDFGKLVNPKGHMIHILPSRCQNTFEYWIAKSAIDGIDKNLGNRYYYEHPGHLRRLSAEEFSEHGNIHGFELNKKYFANKIFGTINWITRSNTTFIRNMFSTNRVKNVFQKFLFLILLVIFIVIAFFRTPAIQLPKAYEKRKKSKRKYLLFLMYLGLYPLSYIIDSIISFLAELEWGLYKKSGSEMYLFFARNKK